MSLNGKIVAGSFDVVINGKEAARKMDLTDHAGVIAGGCPTVIINGAAFLAARMTDPMNCPSPDDGGHIGSMIVGGSPDVFIGGGIAARKDDPVLCGGGGAGGGGGDGGAGAGGGGDAPSGQTECQKLWAKYEAEAAAMLVPGKDARERNKIISGAYADLYLKNPEFKWAGLAAYASKQVGCAMDFAKSRADLIPPVAQGLKPLHNSYAYTYAMLGYGNAELFKDVYPLHRFFSEHGFAKMAQCAGERRPPLDAQALDAFRAIDLYRKTGDPKYLDQSVKSLAYHEQVAILQKDIYNDPVMRGLLWSNEALPENPFNNPASAVMTSGCEDPGGKNTLTFGDKGRTKLYDVGQRMDWILGDVAKHYNGIAGTPKHIKDLEDIRGQGSQVGGPY